MQYVSSFVRDLLKLLALTTIFNFTFYYCPVFNFTCGYFQMLLSCEYLSQHSFWKKMKFNYYGKLCLSSLLVH